MKPPCEVIPKFIISLEKDKNRATYLKNEVYPKITNYFKCKAFDGELEDPNPILEENGLFVADHFIEKCNAGQLGCFLSHFNLWKYIVENNLELAIVMEDDIKIYKNFNRTINTIYENLPVKFDYVHLFIHPDKLKIEYLEGNDGDVIPAEDNFGTVAYMISLRGAKRLIKLTHLLKIQAPVDRQINFCIQHHFLKAYMVKKPFLITQGEIMPNRAIYNESFKSNIWYSRKLVDSNIVNQKYVKVAGFSDEELIQMDREIEKNKKKSEKQVEKNLKVETKREEVIESQQAENAEQKTNEESSDGQKSEKPKENPISEEDAIVSSIIERLVEKEVSANESDTEKSLNCLRLK